MIENCVKVGGITMRFKGDALTFEYDGKRVSYSGGERLLADFHVRVASDLGVKDPKIILKLLLQKAPLRGVEEFSIVEHVYRKMTKPLEARPSSSLKEWDLYIAKLDVLNPPFFVLDTDGYVSPVRKNLSVEGLAKSDVLDVLESVTNRVRKRITTAGVHYGLRFDEDASLEEKAGSLASNNLLPGCSQAQGSLDLEGNGLASIS